MKKIIIIISLLIITLVSLVSAFELHELWDTFENTDHEISGSWNVVDGQRWHDLTINVDSDTAFRCLIKETGANCYPV